MTGVQTCSLPIWTVEVGKIADLIVVGGNPLEDIHNVRRLQMVFKDGLLVSDKRPRHRTHG